MLLQICDCWSLAVVVCDCDSKHPSLNQFQRKNPTPIPSHSSLPCSAIASWRSAHQGCRKLHHGGKQTVTGMSSHRVCHQRHSTMWLWQSFLPPCGIVIQSLHMCVRCSGPNPGTCVQWACHMHARIAPHVQACLAPDTDNLLKVFLLCVLGQDARNSGETWQLTSCWHPCLRGDIQHQDRPHNSSQRSCCTVNGNCDSNLQCFCIMWSFPDWWCLVANTINNKCSDSPKVCGALAEAQAALQVVVGSFDGKHFNWIPPKWVVSLDTFAGTFDPHVGCLEVFGLLKTESSIIDVPVPTPVKTIPSAPSVVPAPVLAPAPPTPVPAPVPAPNPMFVGSTLGFAGAPGPGGSVGTHRITPEFMASLSMLTEQHNRWQTQHRTGIHGFAQHAHQAAQLWIKRCHGCHGTGQ